jgi:phosphatidylinositol alpha-1,6-mannosyltransferase
MRGSIRNLVFWHVDLLKLLPLIGHGRVCLFLHGIECWRRLDGRMQKLLAKVDTFLTNSDFTWRQFTELNPEWKGSRHTTVALGLGEPAREAVNPGSVPAALIVGRLSRAESYKGHRELIEAWPMVVRERPDAELWIVGGGDGVSDLQGLAASLRVEQQVRFFGPVSESEKERLLQATRCLVLPSRGEGFGLAYLEAMRHGRPCLTSDRDAGREVVAPPEAGMSVDPSDTDALAASVLRMLQPGAEWQDWSDGARRRYEASFTAAHFQQRLLAAVMGGAQ